MSEPAWLKKEHEHQVLLSELMGVIYRYADEKEVDYDKLIYDVAICLLYHLREDMIQPEGVAYGNYILMCRIVDSIEHNTETKSEQRRIVCQLFKRMADSIEYEASRGWWRLTMEEPEKAFGPGVKSSIQEVPLE